MKRKVSFKMFFALVWRGIWQAVCWVASMFGYKDQTTYGKVVRRVFAGSVAVVAAVIAALVAYFGFMVVKEDLKQRADRKTELTEMQLSARLSFMLNYNSWEYSYLFDYTTNKKLLEGKIAWVVRSADSLAVFSDGRKSGYINRFTGKVQIPAEYDHAWVFSDSVACVQKDGKAFFIDHDGKPICNKTFAPPLNKDEGYVFHRGFCAVSVKENDWGLIDKDGQWQLDGSGYENIRSESHGGRYYWVITAQGGAEGVFTEILGRIMEMWYSNIAFDETGIYATDNQGRRRKYDFEGGVVEDFVCTDVIALTYETDEQDEDGNAIDRKALCKAYYTDDEHCGLMSADGNPITPAVYKGIQAISPDRYLCDLADKEYVILDNLGHRVVK